ncbi:MAG: hypothetical protein NXI30_27725 [bacterium]|nr:hypothetical protein [bacterium]
MSVSATGGASGQQIAAGFSVPDGSQAVAIEWWGAHDSPATDPTAVTLELRLFADDLGLPETAATEVVSLDFEATPTGFATGNGDAIYAYSAAIDPPLLLFGGDQWLSIVQVSPTPGDWLWVSADELPVLIADRFGTDADPWTPGLSFRGNRAIRVLPEPATAALLAVGSLALLAAGARRAGHPATSSRYSSRSSRRSRTSASGR